MSDRIAEPMPDETIVFSEPGHITVDASRLRPGEWVSIDPKPGQVICVDGVNLTVPLPRLLRT